MRKQKFNAGIITILFLLMMVLSASAVQAASTKYLLKDQKKSTSVYADLTGDGKSEKIGFFIKKDECGNNTGLKVTVNGKTSFVKTKFHYYEYEVKYIYQSKNRQFIQVIAWGDSGMRDINAIYKYDKKQKKLVCVLDVSESGVGAGTLVDKVTSTSIRIPNVCMPSLVGRVQWYYTYKYVNGKFKLVSSTPSVKSIFGRKGAYDPGDGYNKYFRKNQFIANKNLTFYTNTDMKKPAFSVKPGAVVTLSKVKITKNGMYMSFRYKSKTGWMNARRDSAFSFKGVSSRMAGGFLG